MRVSPPCLRAPNHLSLSSKGQILTHMENFPTPKLAMVPRVANVLTLAFLAGTTLWSSAQRPVVHETAAYLTAPKVSSATNKRSQLPVDNGAQANRSPNSSAISGDGIISVGFNGASLR